MKGSKWLADRQFNFLIGVNILVVVVATWLSHGQFVDIDNLQSMGGQLPELGLLALGIMLSMVSGNGGIDLYDYSPLVYALNQTDIALTGGGTLDAQDNVAPWPFQAPQPGAALDEADDSRRAHLGPVQVQLVQLVQRRQVRLPPRRVRA